MVSLRSLVAAMAVIALAACPRKARDDGTGAATAAPPPEDGGGSAIDGPIPEPAPMPGSGGTGDAGPFS